MNDDEIHDEAPLGVSTVGRTLGGEPLTPGYNVDRIDIDAGCKKAAEIGYDDDRSQMVVTYALQRWQRGEEDGAHRTVLSGGIDLTPWFVILAAARGSAEAAVAPEPYRANPHWQTVLENQGLPPNLVKHVLDHAQPGETVFALADRAHRLTAAVMEVWVSASDDTTVGEIRSRAKALSELRRAGS